MAGYRGTRATLLILLLLSTPQAWRLPVPSQQAPNGCEDSTQAVLLQCQPPYPDSVLGYPAELFLELLLAAVASLLLLGAVRVLAVDPQDQQGVLVMPVPHYLPGHQTAPRPRRPPRPMRTPDWYCCCLADNRPTCRCDRSAE